MPIKIMIASLVSAGDQRSMAALSPGSGDAHLALHARRWPSRTPHALARLRKQQMESDLAFATSVQQSFLARSSRVCCAITVGTRSGRLRDFIPAERVGVLIGVYPEGRRRIWQGQLGFSLRAVQQADAVQCWSKSTICCASGASAACL
jgi:hypothetical protein